MGDPDSSYFLRTMLLLFLFIARWVCASGQRDKNDTGRPKSLALASTFVGLCAAGIGATTYSRPIATALMRAIPVLHPAGAYSISFIIIVLLMAFLLRLCGDMPKRLPHGKASAFSRLLAGVFAPGGWLLDRVEAAFLALLGHPLGSDEATEEELRMLIDVGERDGTFEKSEKAMLEGILELSDSTAAAMMTHRTEITALQREASLAQVIEVALESGHSRIPVYEEDMDTIVGILYVKDLLVLVGKGELEDTPFDLGNYLREPLYVLETTPADTLLGEFKTKKIQIAIVVDEYGGTSGLVSMEDLLEEIVGNIQDEYDDEEEEIAEIQDNQYLVDGLTSLDDVLKFFAIEGIDEAEEYDTIGGYVLGMQGGPLSETDHPVSHLVGNVRFTVREMDRSRISKLLAEILPGERCVPGEE